MGRTWMVESRPAERGSPDGESVRYAAALRLFARVLALQLLAVALFNFLVNPFRRYPTHLVPAIITDDHSAKLELLRSQRPHLLVLGSSRVLKLEPAYLERRTGLPAFNLGVSNGLPEDALCLLRYATEGLGLPIEQVILGVDVDTFHPTAPVNPPLLTDIRLRRYLPADLRPGAGELLADLSQALTLDQLKASLRALGPRPPRQATWFGPDGFLHDERDDLPLDPNLDLRLCMARFSDFPRLSTARLGYLDELARLCRRRGIRLTLFLTCLHDSYIHAVAATYEPRYRELVPLLRHRAASGWFAFYDCSRVADYGGDPDDFLDLSHVKVGNARRIIDHVLQ